MPAFLVSLLLLLAGPTVTAAPHATTASSFKIVCADGKKMVKLGQSSVCVARHHPG